MEKRLAITTAASEEPVDAAYVKLHARIDIDDDDTWIEQRITAARTWVEKFTGKTFAYTKYTLKCPAFTEEDADYLILPKGPVVTVDSVAYRATGSSTYTTLSGSAVETETDEHGNSRLRFAYGETKPSLANAWDAVKVVYYAGPASGTPTAVDERVRQCIAMVVAYWYENRESTHMDVPESIQSSARGLLWDLVATDC